MAVVEDICTTAWNTIKQNQWTVALPMIGSFAVLRCGQSRASLPGVALGKSPHILYSGSTGMVVFCLVSLIVTWDVENEWGPVCSCCPLGGSQDVSPHTLPPTNDYQLSYVRILQLWKLPSLFVSSTMGGVVQIFC